jgi:hypothetical protein
MHSTAALTAGPARDALVLALRTLELADTAAPALKARTLTDVAHCYRALGALHQTEFYLLQALRWSRMLGAPDAQVDLLCELADLAVQTAASDTEDNPRAAHRAREKARDLAFEAAALACRSADPHWEVQVLLRVSDALDRCGDHSDAIALQCRALHLLCKGEVALSNEPRTDAQAVM